MVLGFRVEGLGFRVTGLKIQSRRIGFSGVWDLRGLGV